MEPLRPDDPREFGRYRLLRRIGAGGMGVVYLAVSVDGAEADLAAVKAIRPEYAADREFRARFTGEVDLARRVQGPYTARVLDADTDGPTPWLATEYVPGPALNDAVRDNGPFPEGSLLALAAGLAEALSAIHTVGLIHRDLKPSNVLLASRGPRVIDFGIARATDATALTRTGQRVGTPAYMSPEQATGAGLDPRSDLFAFGGVLLFAATGRPPFGTGDPAALLYRVVNEEPDLAGLPAALLPLVTACLAKNPDDRPDPGSIADELTGTLLPRDEDAHPTEWLPSAVATTIRHTLVAATRIAPDTAPPSPEEEPADAAPVPPPSAPGPPGVESAEDSTVPGPPQGAEDHTRRTSSVLLGSIVAAVAALVVVLGMTRDPSDGATPRAQSAPDGGEATEAAPAPPSSATDAPPRVVDTRIEDTAFLGDDRFAVLSTAGVHVFETDRPAAVERLTESDEDFTFVYSQLAATPDGTRVAAVAMGSGTLEGIHVWDLDESERYVVDVPGTQTGHLAISLDGETLFLGRTGSGGNVAAFDVTSGERLYRIALPENEQGRRSGLTGLGTSSDGELLIAALDTGLAVWDAASGGPHPSSPELRAWPGEITGPAVFGEDFVATATFDSLLLWDMRSEEGPEEFRLPPGDREENVRIHDVSFGDGETRIVTAGRNADRDRSFLIVWDTEGEVLAEDRSERDYSSVHALSEEGGALVAHHPIGQDGREELVFLDEDLALDREFQVPTR
ncbi:WD40 repeat domain-containing serine/threonine protein kinase [Nocardiopsis aegyptia]|uniref:WD40 repeat domain-containing serine/threonine protein kinase n=1 Tax=Nocardiopsis aegyptia TaxID=220378 RepID=UPI00366CA21B